MVWMGNPVSDDTYFTNVMPGYARVFPHCDFQFAQDPALWLMSLRRCMSDCSQGAAPHQSCRNQFIPFQKQTARYSKSIRKHKMQK